MPGFITSSLGNPGGDTPDLDALPSSTTERVDPLALLRQIGRFAAASTAETGIVDPETGAELAPPEPLMPKADAQQKYGSPGAPSLGVKPLTFQADLPESVAQSLLEAKQDEINRANARARSPGGAGAALADLGYGFLDPVGLAASALPVFGEARIATILGRAGIDLGSGLAGRAALRVATGAADATATNVPLVAARYALSQREQADYTMSDAARDLAYGAGMGAVLHPLIGGLTDLLHNPDLNAAAIHATTAAVLEDRPADAAGSLADVAQTQAPAVSYRRVADEADLGNYAAFTPGGMRIEARPEVVPLDSLIYSHGPDGTANPDYPAELQGRNRAALASQAQITDLAAQLQPERLGPSPEAGAGAPIVGPDQVVESGNGRIAAIQRVYDTPELAHRADAYKAWLDAQGYDTTGIDKPVLIGRRVTDMTPDERVAWAAAANERPNLGMNAAEQANADAGRVGAAIDLFQGGDLSARQNRDFVGAFMAQLPAQERGGLMKGTTGELNLTGERRIRAALVAHAYGSHLGPTLERMLEGDAEHIKSTANALADVAGPWGRMRAAAARGDIPADLDITPAIADAVRLMDEARQTKVPVGELLAEREAQGSLLGGQNPTTRPLMRLFFQNDAMTRPAGRDRIAELLRGYAEAADHVDPRPDLWGNPPASAGDILRSIAGSDAGVRAAAALDAATARAQSAVPPADAPEWEGLSAENRQTLADLYQRAADAKPAFDSNLAAIANSVDGRLIRAPLKGLARAVGKILGDYEGDASRIKDLLRATIEVPSITDAQRALAELSDHLAIDPSTNVRNTLKGDATADGYRDIKLNVKVNGITAEVQINVPEMLRAKEIEHPLYEQIAALDRLERKAPLSEAQSNERQMLIERQGTTYSAAWDAALATDERMRSNSSRETLRPLWRADTVGNRRGGSRSQAVEKYGASGQSSETGIPSTSKNRVFMADTSAATEGGELGEVNPVARMGDATAAQGDRAANIQQRLFDSDTARQAGGELAPEDAATLRQAELAAKAPPQPAGTLTPELTKALAEAEAQIAHARAAGVLSADDEAELRAIDEATGQSASRQSAILQAAACVARGMV